jgi:hypothetical protein
MLLNKFPPMTGAASPNRVGVVDVRVAASGGAKVIKRYHVPSTPCKRALVHPKLAAAVKKRLREQYRTLDPVALLAEIRAAQEELGNRVDRRAACAASARGADHIRAMKLEPDRAGTGVSGQR